MSTESFLAFYGVRRTIDPRSTEFAALERNQHPWSLLARRRKLDVYCGNFHREGGEEYYVFIGRRLGLFGGENLRHRDFSDEALWGLMQEVRQALHDSDVEGHPSLHLAWEPDY